MRNKNIYHLEYQRKYNSQYVQKAQFSNWSIEKFSISISFLCLPFIFTFLLSFFLLIHNHNKQKSVLANNYTPKINFLDLKINKSQKFIHSPFIDDKYISKFEEVNKDFKNNSLNEIISLKKVSLPNNISKEKKKFINKILPLIVGQNQKIIAQRNKLNDVKYYLIHKKTLSKEDQKYINNLASKYLIITKNKHKIDVINELLLYVDIIPNSIVLAQAVNESGWGTSRFARDYNALFGQYTYDNKNGVVPSKRDKGKKHLIKFFSSINQSIESYFININSHPAYSKFRNLRKQLRDSNNILEVELLLNGLGSYAADKNYVSIIKSIININGLKRYDNIKSLKIYL